MTTIPRQDFDPFGHMLEAAEWVESISKDRTRSDLDMEEMLKGYIDNLSDEELGRILRYHLNRAADGTTYIWEDPEHWETGWEGSDNEESPHLVQTSSHAEEEETGAILQAKTQGNPPQVNEEEDYPWEIESELMGRGDLLGIAWLAWKGTRVSDQENARVLSSIQTELLIMLSDLIQDSMAYRIKKVEGKI